MFRTVPERLDDGTESGSFGHKPAVDFSS